LTEYPLISIIVPCRNEDKFIERTINSLLNTNYPLDKIEVLAVDGMSDDGTKDILDRLSGEIKQLRVYENKNKIAPCAFNIGLKNMKGDYFVIVGGHSEIPNDFLNKSLQCLMSKKDAWVAGGSIETVSDTFTGKAIAAAMQSPIGVGNSMFRLGNHEGYVDTLTFGLHHKWVIDKIGCFDEELVRNQDDEFNARLINAGGKIWMSKDVTSRYYSRGSLGKLWKQYFQYGFWRIRTIQKLKKPATIRQVVPLLFVLSLLVLTALSFFVDIFRYFLAAEIVLYFIGITLGSINVGKKTGWKYALVSPLIFTILHFGYGIGCLWGGVRFVVLGGFGMPKPEQYSISR